MFLLAITNLYAPIETIDQVFEGCYRTDGKRLTIKSDQTESGLKFDFTEWT